MEAAVQVQGGFDLEHGPLARLIHFSSGPGAAGRLLWAIHHLVVDGVSWRVLLEDLETAYSQAHRGLAPVLPAKTTSFKAWAERLAAHARSGVPLEEAGHWRAVGRARAQQLPVDLPEGRRANTVGSAGTVTVELSPEETRVLLQEVPAVYRTQINDALLAALAQAIASWTGSPCVRIDLEGHGREPLFTDLDLSRTVGWFTSQFPVVIDLTHAAGSGAALVAVKEQLRAIPNRGISYGLLRHLDQPDPETARTLREAPSSDVIFNYLGQIGPPPAIGAPIFAAVPEPTGPTRSARSHRSFLLEVNSLVAAGRLQVSFQYSSGAHRRTTVERLAAAVAAKLRELILHCRAAEEPLLTPSDFPLARLNEETFRELSLMLDEVD